MNNWKTTLGGALSALGSTLMGVGTVTSLSGHPTRFLLWIATIGFLLSAFGKFFGMLFATDKKE